MTGFTESVVEDAALDWLKASGWRIAHGPDIAPDMPAAERRNYGEVRRIDELHLELPFAGSRTLRDLLVEEGFEVGRKHVATLMRKMGVEALYRRANTSRRHPRHPV